MTKHDCFGFNTTNTPTNDTKTVDHGGMAVGPDHALTGDQPRSAVQPSDPEHAEPDGAGLDGTDRHDRAPRLGGGLEGALGVRPQRFSGGRGRDAAPDAREELDAQAKAETKTETKTKTKTETKTEVKPIPNLPISTSRSAGRR